jgi:hypothetical protein
LENYTPAESSELARRGLTEVKDTSTVPGLAFAVHRSGLKAVFCLLIDAVCCTTNDNCELRTANGEL